VNFVKDGLLHSLLSLKVKHSSVAVFNLHRPHALAANVLTKGIVEPAPEGFVFFLFNDGEDVSFCALIFSILRYFEAIC
jgi:hypothetical protein